MFDARLETKKYIYNWATLLPHLPPPLMQVERFWMWLLWWGWSGYRWSDFGCDFSGGAVFV
jgi:hypothetical protein